MERVRALSWNVNGVRAVLKKGFLEWFAGEAPDILCIQETKAWVDQLPEALTNVPGYQAFYCSGERKGYSGVAIYTKVPPQDVSYGFRQREHMIKRGAPSSPTLEASCC